MLPITPMRRNQDTFFALPALPIELQLEELPQPTGFEPATRGLSDQARISRCCLCVPKLGIEPRSSVQ